MISKEGFSKLTLRALGDQVGVSRTAPYRHFSNKTDLLCAVAAEGFKELRRRYTRVSSDNTINATARFQRMAMAYVEHALENPGPYRLMFGHELIAQKRTPELLESAKATFNDFVSATEAFLEENKIGPDNLMPLVNFSWITVHGLSTLLIENQIKTTGEGHGVPSLLIGAEDLKIDSDQEKIEFAQKTLAEFLRMVLL